MLLWGLTVMPPHAHGAISSSESRKLESAEMNQGGPGAKSERYQQKIAVGSQAGHLTLFGSRFRISSGVIGSTFSGGATTTPNNNQLDLTVLYAKTAPAGLAIQPQTWQRDADPLFIWEPPASGLELAGYSYAIDVAPDETIDTTATSYDLAANKKLLSAGQHTFSVLAVNSAGNVGKPASFAIWVDALAPSVGATTPATGALLNTKTPTVRVEVVEEHSGVDDASIELLVNGSAVETVYDAQTRTVTAHPIGAFQERANTIELRLQDLAGNSLTPLVWSVTVDTVPPTGTIVINGGSELTTNPYVTLELSASDVTSGVAGMRLSNEALLGYVQEPFAPVRELWLLNAVQGFQRVYVRFVDAAGNESASIYDEIDVALLSPETIITVGPAGVTLDPSAAFTFMCPQGECVFSYAFDNEHWSAWSTQTEASIANLAAGNHYFRVKAARDVNGVSGIQPEEEDFSPAERTWIVAAGTPTLMGPFGPPIKLWRVE